MAIFDLLKKNKKKKEEVIYIEEKKDEEIILEKKEEVRSEINPDLDINSLYVSYNTLKNKLNSLYNEYYKCKIFSRVDLDDSENEKLEKDLDLYVDSLDSNVKEIEQSMTKCDSNDINEINRIYENIEKNNLAFKIINERIIDINNEYYKRLKVSTASMCFKMNNEELKHLYMELSRYINEYEGIVKASDYIYYSSGELIVSLVCELLFCIVKTNNKDYINKYVYSYFLSSDVIITIDVNEWIELYNKINYCMRFIKDIDDKYKVKFNQLYKDFETRYVILMIKTEMKR